jgi:hypothetical protein
MIYLTFAILYLAYFLLGFSLLLKVNDDTLQADNAIQAVVLITFWPYFYIKTLIKTKNQKPKK